MPVIVTTARAGLFEVVDLTEAPRTGDTLAELRAKASGAFRRQHQAWPDTVEQTVDGKPAYPPAGSYKKEASNNDGD